ncbi:MAG: nucleoside triphosphate pyrophosphatase [Lautropia sp.]
MPNAPCPAVTPPSIWLASRSPRRLALLEQIGVHAELLLDEDEARAEALETPLPGELPSAYVARVARAKALAACGRLDPSPAPAPRAVLAADTTVAIGSRILAKPTDADDAIRMLTSLQGRSHRVYTAVALALPVGFRGAATVRVHQRLHASQVRMRRLKPAEIERYVRSGEPFGKAGGYAIQGLAAAFVRRIDGSHSGIMGLPIFETVQLLRKADIFLP